MVAPRPAVCVSPTQLAMLQLQRRSRGVVPSRFSPLPSLPLPKTQSLAVELNGAGRAAEQRQATHVHVRIQKVWARVSSACIHACMHFAGTPLGCSLHTGGGKSARTCKTPRHDASDHGRSLAGASLAVRSRHVDGAQNVARSLSATCPRCSRSLASCGFGWLMGLLPACAHTQRDVMGFAEVGQERARM